ncbi:MAG: DUF1570 domain-containing protein [Planctomycetaceae bacterium]
MTARIALATLALMLGTAEVSAGPPQLLELRTDDETFHGRLAAHDDDFCWLMARDGRLSRIELDAVRSFRSTGEAFQPFTLLELRNELRADYGQKLDVVVRGRYVVCAEHGKAAEYAALFDDIYRSVRGYFQVRGFSMPEPEFPLVALVFPDRDGFAAHCADDGFSAFRGLKGYYTLRSNRVAVFDPGEETLSLRSDLRAGPCRPGLLRISSRGGGSLRDTIVHEAVHQIAFNCGLHSRIGETPKWIVEGLAMVFESEAVRRRSPSDTVAARINLERFLWFGDFVKHDRRDRSLTAFLSDDAAFKSNALDAYGEAWALSFYLLEKRPADYARYLRQIAGRDPLRPYPPEQRLADFRGSFGSDLDRFESQYLRFIDSIEVQDR